LPFPLVLVDAPIGAQLMIVQGPMARRVADLQAAFEVMAGPRWRDPWTVPPPLRGPEPAKPVRVALVVDPAGSGTAKQVQDCVPKAGRALEDAGNAIDEVEPPSIVAASNTAPAMLNTPEFRAALQMRSSFVADETQRFLSAFYEVAGDSDR
jgi:amidase